MAVKQVDFYSDFMSPYAYLPSTRLPALKQRYENTARFVLHPIDMVHARFKARNIGPFNRDVPAKIKCLMADLKRWSQRYGIPFGFPGRSTARDLSAASYARSIEVSRTSTCATSTKLLGGRAETQMMTH